MDTHAIMRAQKSIIIRRLFSYRFQSQTFYFPRGEGVAAEWGKRGRGERLFITFSGIVPLAP